MNPRYAAVSNRAIHRCEYCRAPESIYNLTFEVENIIPPVHGGTNRLSNMALVCRSCNLHKSSHLFATDPESAEEVPLFNPRTNPWPDHFAVDSETLTIVGLTPVGRATVDRLNMNCLSQRTARRFWAELGLFP